MGRSKHSSLAEPFVRQALYFGSGHTDESEGLPAIGQHGSVFRPDDFEMHPEAYAGKLADSAANEQAFADFSR